MGAEHLRLDCGPEEAVSCTLVDPSGERTAFSGPCRHPVDRVRAKHRGTWNCTFLLPGYQRALSDQTTLTLAGRPTSGNKVLILPGFLLVD